MHNSAFDFWPHLTRYDDPLNPGVDSLCSEDEADSFLGQRLHTDDWPFLLDPSVFVNDDGTAHEYTDSTQNAAALEENQVRLEKKRRALRLATVMLNSERYQGQPTDTAQPLEWPRTGLTDRNLTPVPSNSIPQDIKRACAELAFSLIRNDLTDDRIRRVMFRLKSERIGESNASYFQAPESEYPPMVRGLIRPFLFSGTTTSAPLIP